eukprot:TRINITY_DN4877_c0_g1_i2.p1 TRINITY_DN4877_c0_g1~~TRINITY_DN4877_c0_g1_i2.p1  ORF type:complete len:1255 (+),score=283.88 TRINITY_DN4877_c0_g1_i2:46-3810(+)
MDSLADILSSLEKLEIAPRPAKSASKAKLPHLDFTFDLVQCGVEYVAQVPRLRPPLIPEQPVSAPLISLFPHEIPLSLANRLERVVDECLSLKSKELRPFEEMDVGSEAISFRDLIDICPHPADFQLIPGRDIHSPNTLIHEVIGDRFIKRDASGRIVQSREAQLPPIFQWIDANSVANLNPKLRDAEPETTQEISGLQELELLDQAQDLLDIPVGFERGMRPRFEKPQYQLNHWHEYKEPIQAAKGRAIPYRKRMAQASNASTSGMKLETKVVDNLLGVTELDFLLSSDPVADTKKSVTAASAHTSDIGGMLSIKRSSSLDDLLALDENPAAKIGSASSSGNRAYTYAVEEKLSFSNMSDVIPDMAMEYPFKLDKFQQEAVYRVENHQHVFVAAHTSAGKTVVAEYAIASAMKHMTKAVYTSPIKALSNQKFREFKATFGEVGLLTGDVTINPTAPCLIMTTEILRLHLYKGSDLIRDLEYVIFDEIHYVNDAERGVVWEEVLIMLPEHITLVMLSATVPNVMEFADWVGRLNKKPVYVVSTLQRPVPLDFQLFYDSKTYSIFATGMTEINKKTYYNATEARKAKMEKAKTAGRQVQHRSSGPSADQLSKMIKYLKEKELLPCVVFVFSKKKCDEYASLISKTDLNNSYEKSQVEVFVNDSLSKLPAADRNLPQIRTIKESMKRGIGVHHSGLLPIVREMVEILFSRGVVKVLFATETFAMGVNMPAKSVAFTSIRKHDGKEFRTLQAGEFIQMSGRAGRRGLDQTGTVLLCCWDDILDLETLGTILIRKPIPLQSQFRIPYGMILNLHRVDNIKVEDMIRKSFSEFHTQRKSPELARNLERAQARFTQIPKIECISGEPDIENYYENAASARILAKSVMQQILDNKSAAPTLSTGRIVLINTKQMRNAYAVLLDGGSIKTGVKIYRAVAFNDFETKTVQIQPSEIFKITKVSVKLDPKSKPADIALAYAQEAKKRALPKGDPYPFVQPSKDLKMSGMDFVEDYLRMTSAADRLAHSKCHACPKLSEHYDSLHAENLLTNLVVELQTQLSDQGLGLMPEYTAKIEVLKALGYMKEDESLSIKGRVAAEFRSPKCELIATELIFQNVLLDLSPAEIAGVLSCLIFEEKGDEEDLAFPALNNAMLHVTRITKDLADIQQECAVNINFEDYLAIPNFRMADATYEWASGVPFAKLKDFTSVMEGSIVRCIVRLSEFCKEMKSAARIIGDLVFYEKMEKVIEVIKRDIVFAASLYVS